LAHLLAADVDASDLTAVALGDAQRRCADAAARVKHALARLQARHLPDQVGVGVERLRQRLAARAEVSDMEVIAVEQARVVGDQVEVRRDAGRCPSPRTRTGSAILIPAHSLRAEPAGPPSRQVVTSI